MAPDRRRPLNSLFIHFLSAASERSPAAEPGSDGFSLGHMTVTQHHSQPVQAAKWVTSLPSWPPSIGSLSGPSSSFLLKRMICCSRESPAGLWLGPKMAERRRSPTPLDAARLQSCGLGRAAQATEFLPRRRRKCLWFRERGDSSPSEARRFLRLCLVRPVPAEDE